MEWLKFYIIGIRHNFSLAQKGLLKEKAYIRYVLRLRLISKDFNFTILHCKLFWFGVFQITDPGAFIIERKLRMKNRLERNIRRELEHIDFFDNKICHQSKEIKKLESEKAKHQKRINKMISKLG